MTDGTRVIKYWINDELIAEYTDAEGATGTNFGFRCAALTNSNAPHRFSVVSLKAL